MPDTISQNLAKAVKKKLKLSFKKARLAESALTHPSFRNENPPDKLLDFDRLEFFGDSILNYVVCRTIYRRYPKADEGELSRIRSIIVSRKILARVAKEIELHKIVRLGAQVESMPLKFKDKILADTLEAVFAALYLDQGLDKAERFILKHLKPYLDVKRLTRLNPNPKSALQELTQRHWQKLPTYTNRNVKDGIHVTVLIGRKFRAGVTARSKKEAEEKAARILLRKIRQAVASESKSRSSAKISRNTL